MHLKNNKNKPAEKKHRLLVIQIKPDGGIGWFGMRRGSTEQTSRTIRKIRKEWTIQTKLDAIKGNPSQKKALVKEPITTTKTVTKTADSKSNNIREALFVFSNKIPNVFNETPLDKDKRILKTRADSIDAFSASKDPQRQTNLTKTSHNGNITTVNLAKKESLSVQKKQTNSGLAPKKISKE
jgi:hypothetical protein